MAEQPILEIRLNSEELTPGKMNSRHIGALIHAVEQMLAAVIVRDNPHLALEEKDVTIGLSAVHPGSYRLQFESQYDVQVRAAYEAVTTVIANGDFEKLPPRSFKALLHIQKVAREYRTEMLMGYLNGTFQELAAISASTPIVVETPTMTGETVLYGVLTSIGGTDPPVAKLRLLDGQLQTCNVTEKDNLRVARELGQRLYTEVGVRGEVRWDLRDMSIDHFRIDEVLSYRTIPITEAISNTYDVMGEYLETIDDIENYFADLRDDGERV